MGCQRRDTSLEEALGSMCGTNMGVLDPISRALFRTKVALWQRIIHRLIRSATTRSQQGMQKKLTTAINGWVQMWVHGSTPSGGKSN